MRRGFWIAALCASLWMGAALAQDDKPYVVESSGNKILGDDIAANAQGAIRLTIGQVSRTFAPGSFQSAWTPEKGKLAETHQAFDAGKYDAVVESVNALLPTYKFLGWGEKLVDWQGRSLLALKKYKEAEDAFRQGSSLVKSRSGAALLKAGLVQSYIGQGQFDKAEKEIGEAMTTDKDVAPLVFQCKGMLSERKGDKKQAVLDYLKVVLLFPDAGAVRTQSLQKVVELMKELKDVRAAEFEKMLREAK